MRTVIGDDRYLSLCVCLLDCTDLVFRHIHSRENEIDHIRYFLNLLDIPDNNVLYAFRHRCIHLPLAADSFLISLACTSCTCCKHFDFVPGMVVQKRYKTLSYHTCRAKNTNTQFFTHITLSSIYT